MDLLAPVKEEHTFVLKDGRQIASLAELKSMVHSLEDSVFQHHVNEDKNDFATWVNDIHQDKILALELNKAKSKEQISDAISDRVKELMSPKNSAVMTDTKETKNVKAVSMRSKSLKVPVLKKIKKSDDAFELLSLKEPIVIKSRSLAKRNVTVNVPDEAKSVSKRVETVPDADIPETSLDLLRPKGSLKKSFFPFLKKDEKDIKQMSFEDIRQDKGKCPNKQFMHCGVYDFFKGAIIGIIIGALLAMAML